MSFKSEIAPKGLHFYSSEFVISDRYATILTVVSYPGIINPGYLANLISGVSGVRIVAKHIPIAFSVLAKMLNKQLADIQDRYQSNPQMMQQKMMEFYKEHKFNPMGGCLPLLIQLPIFILLYSALMSPQFKQTTLISSLDYFFPLL